MLLRWDHVAAPLRPAYLRRFAATTGAEVLGRGRRHHRELRHALRCRPFRAAALPGVDLRERTEIELANASEEDDRRDIEVGDGEVCPANSCPELVAP
jgi:hypothetical protein